MITKEGVLLIFDQVYSKNIELTSALSRLKLKFRVFHRDDLSKGRKSQVKVKKI